MCNLATMIMEGNLGMYDGKITLDFDGYHSIDDNQKPEEAGIYCIYRADSKGKPLELLYIGESGDIKERFSNHEHYEDWREKLRKDEKLVFSYATVKGECARKRAEAALIFMFKPVCNTQDKNSFNYNTTTVTVKGNFTCFKFTVRKDERSE